MPWQPSLLGLQTPDIDPSFRGIRRTDLGQGAWIEDLTGWCAGHSRLFEQLRQKMRWQSQKMRMYDRMVDVPRLLATVPEDGPGFGRDGVLTAMAMALSGRYGTRFDRISLAYYRDGRDSVAWHGDRILRDQAGDSLVATVSVGERRRFLIRPKRLERGVEPARARPSSSRETVALTLGWGDLVVMGGSCQRVMEHSVPKCAQAGPRIAIMFRCSYTPK